MSDTTHSAPGSGSPGSSQGGQQQSSATPTGGMPIEQIDRAQADRRENPNTRGISPARDQREAAAARAAGQQPSGEQQGNQQQQGSQPAAGGDEKIKFGDQELTVAELADLRKFKGEQDSRALTLPPTPEAYELKVPENFQLPAGVSKFEFNQNDPFLAQARQLAHRDKISQASFSEILGIYAGQRVAEATVINNARTAELAKLGGAATDRITAIRTFLHGTIGSDQAAAVEQMLCAILAIRPRARTAGGQNPRLRQDEF